MRYRLRCVLFGHKWFYYAVGDFFEFTNNCVKCGLTKKEAGVESQKESEV